MPEFLSFTLAAPLAAMGDLAVGERRGGWDRPGRSALLGLVAGCLGIDRAEEASHQALEAFLGLALRVEQLGPVLADYHTAQVPPRRRGRVFATRAEELAAPDLATILTRRDYRCGLLAFVALWHRPVPPTRSLVEASVPDISLGAIAQALRAPVFVPYLGRKSCPLMLPMAPDIGIADDPVAALAAHAAREAGRGMADLRLGAAASPVVTMDRADTEGMAVARVEMRRDRLLSRQRWQFGLREEAVLKMPQ